MKTMLLATLCFSILSGSAQQGAPTASDVRQAIAGEIRELGIRPATLEKMENRSVWNGTDSIPVRIYYPSAKTNLRIIYNIHGGALVGGDLETHENISAELAVRTQSVVVALNYRKAPEFPFPASINDCETVLDWIKKNASSIHGNVSDLVIVGDSGGGLFASVLAVKLKKSLGAKALCLVNPAEDLRTPGEGFYKLVVNWYLAGHTADDSLVSPLVATDFTGFPPTLVITSGKDELKPHGDAIYEKIRTVTRARLFNIPEAGHLAGFWAAAAPMALPAIEETVKFINGGYQ